MKWLLYQFLFSAVFALCIMGPTILAYHLAVVCIVGPFIYSLEYAEEAHKVKKMNANFNRKRNYEDA